MTLRFNLNRNWLLYYQGVLAVSTIFFFFTRLDAYLVEKQQIISPVGWMLPYLALAIPLLILRKGRYPSRSVFFWCLGYFIVAFFSYSLSLRSQTSLGTLLDRSFASAFLLVTTFLFANQHVKNWTKYALMGATAIGVFNNFYQLFIDQSAFGGLVEGRATGTYLDPNDCANALILGMILTIDLLPKKNRFPWLLFVGVGVFLTFSRGGMLGWIIVLIMMTLTRVISPKKIVLGVITIGMLFLVATSLGVGWTGDGSSFYSQLDSVALQRVQGITGGSNSVVEDESTAQRAGIAEKGWQMFLERPVFGYGIGSTFDYSITGFPVSTHNTFLLFAAEYGAIGVLILPLAIYAVIHRARGETSRIGIVFAAFILVVSFFSHTVLALNYYLIPFALMAAMSKSSRVCANSG